MILNVFILFGISGIVLSCDWGHWSSCSQGCGGGTQSRTGHCGSWWGKHSTTESRSCNNKCYNGGYYSGGSCHCPARRTGRCCESLKRCYQDNGGCVETCTPNSHGSTCGCRHPGYKLMSDGRSCTDVDECKTHLCDHNCRNTVGSFICSCNHGYTLSPDKRSCIDNDECQADHVKCEQLCVNTPGSYRCACREGYTLNIDGYSCEDVDECQSNNGGCSHVCKNERGSHSCECPVGFQLDTDKSMCKDFDECSISPSKCQQSCQNQPGSYRCGCSVGYSISSDGKICEDIDDCIGVMCHNGGTCIDGVNSFTCTCTSGFKGKLCQHDHNECLGVFNGGCEDKCINTFGSFKCDCSGNKTLSSDGLFCTGGTGLSVFESQSIFRELLPRGCSTIQLARCTEGRDLKLSLSSTSPWFELKSDRNIQYTLGIVFVELDAFALPVSMTGVEVVGRSSDFSLIIGSVRYTPNQGSPTGFTKNDTRSCWTFEITPRYIHDFLQSLSFLKSFLSNIEKNLPKWISFTMGGTELIGLRDLKTEFLHGSDITNDAWCKGAPVINDRLYSVFKFGGNFSLSIYGDSVELPDVLAGQKYCFIIDICQDYGGSVFLMIPKESRDVLEKVPMFKELSDNYHLHIQPRGIGISLQKHINVNLHSRELELWNGDQTFSYNVFQEANMWIGGDVVLDHDLFHVQAETDIYLTMPSLTSLLASLFIEEWDLLVQTDIGADLQISFKVLGKPFDINFKDIGIASVDIYASLGGNVSRKWCGDGSNPPGFFFSAMAEVNPFKGIPILQDFVFDFTTRLYVFFTSDPSVDASPNDKIDILTDILELEGFLKNFLNTSMGVADKYGVILVNGTLSILEDLEQSINKSLELVHQLVDTLQLNVLNAFTYNWDGIIRSFESIWTSLKTSISDDVGKFFDSVEFQTRLSKHNFSSMFETEINTIKNNLMTTAKKISKQLMRILQDYKGVGFRFTADMKIFVWRFGLIDFEAVHSIDHLGSCGKFKKAFQLFEGDKSFRFSGKVKVPFKPVPFLRMQVGGGVGMAFSIDSIKFLAQLHMDVNLLGIRGSVDLFVNNNGLYFYAEGNLWSYFKVLLGVTAEHGQDWSLLVLRVHGELLADSDGDKDFHDSYLDALRSAIKSLGDAANERLGHAQNALTKAQSGLTSAQNWLESKKKDVRALNSKFDDAIRALERVKDKLEKAKGPFNAAIAKLNAAQRNVDNLCRIEHCSRVCIPGLKCKICHTGGWIHFPYPCCHFTSCMISFPNPICVVKNLACRAIRSVAFLALEAVKIFVRIPILALDVAKIAVSVAQVVVDKARVVLDIAIVAIDLAKFGLEGAKGVLEVAKIGIEVVKQVMKLGFKVLDMIMEYGLKSLVDLKNCMFDVRLTTKDLPVFAVSCEVNVLRFGWSTIKFGVNFNRPFQSLWEAAKETVKSITDTIGHRLFGRKRRDLLHESLLKTHAAFRIAREINSDFNLTDNELNETIDIVFQTAGFHNDSEGDDYENRVGVFKVKCDRYQKMFSYLNEANGVLHEVANETNTMLVSASRMRDDLDSFDIGNIQRNFKIENTGINPEVAMRDYNLTLDDLHAALADANSTLNSDPLLHESSSVSSLSKKLIENSTSTLTNIRITDQWLLAMDNVTLDYFTKDVCVSFLDCAHYSMAELLDVYYAEEFENISEIVSTLSDIEDTFLVLVGNSSLSIQSVYTLSKTIGSLLKHLDELNPLCSSAPVFLSQMVNHTVVRNRDVTILCNVSGNPEPFITWYENGEVLPGEHSKSLVLTNVTRAEATQYMCIAGNVVANLSSDPMYLDVKEFEDVFVDQDQEYVTPIDMRNDTSAYETGTEVSNKDKSDGLSEKVTATPQEFKDVFMDQDLVKVTPIDMKYDTSAYETGIEVSNKEKYDGLSEKVTATPQEKSGLTKVLIASITSGCVVCLVTGLVVWKLYARHKFRKSNKMGSFMSMNMIRPSAANVRFKSAGVDRTVTHVEPVSIVQ